jgi:S-adenosylmethionine:tRNA ribosyltransferase-isomerase
MRALDLVSVAGGGKAPVASRPQPVESGTKDRPLPPRAPLELTGQHRDTARLLVARRAGGRLTHTRMAELGSFLDPGDVVVVNTSTTRPAALVVDDELVVHLSTELDDGSWVVELRHLRGAGTLPWLDHRPGRPLRLPGGGRVEILGPYPPAHRPSAPVRLWTARLALPASVDEYLARYGRPIRYGADARPWPLDAYQTVFASEAGSAEMPSAARGFTAELVTRLVSQGVAVAPIVLHTGVASQESGEPPYPERYRVPDATAAAVNLAHRSGHRVVAVGTTATRAIETVTGPGGVIEPGTGRTDLVITPERGVHAVDGLLTGWHDPEASHLLLVEAVAGRELLDRSYQAAVAAGYHGHEFGDFHLILP